jgi:hypothetical protein
LLQERGEKAARERRPTEINPDPNGEKVAARPLDVATPCLSFSPDLVDGPNVKA